VLGLAIALRALLLTAPPILSTDIYRYVWDGRVQAAGIDPYRYIPADPALASLRDPVVYPQINRADYAHDLSARRGDRVRSGRTALGQRHGHAPGHAWF
jgi:alpha-1,6-mannosyltransferase